MITDDIVYSEVFEVLSYMNKNTVMKIPLEILQYIKYNKNNDYVSNIDPNNIFNVNNISKEARKVLAYLDFKYLTSDEMKDKKLKVYKENEKKYQTNLQQKYNYNNIFKNNTNQKVTKQEIIPDLSNENIIKNTELTEIKENIFQKIIRKVKMFLGKK